MIDALQFQLLKTSQRLPGPSPAAQALLDKLARDDVQLNVITQLIKTDPVLSGRLLRLVNSPAYGQTRPIAAITPEVLMLLGLPVVRNLVLAFALIDTYRERACERFDCLLFWSRSLAQACAAQVLGAIVRVAPAAELFTLGLVGDIGTLALAYLFPQQCDPVKALTPEQAAALAERDRARFGFDRWELSAAMLADWGMPKLFQDAVRWYALPSADWSFPAGSRVERLTQVLATAHAIGDALLCEKENATETLQRYSEWLTAWGITDLSALTAEVHHAWRQWSGVLSLPRLEKQLPCAETQTSTLAVVTAEASTMSDVARTPGRILIVEDDPAARRMFERVLEKQGHQVWVAASVDEALPLLAEAEPEVLLTDLVMPDKSGFDLIARIRSDKGRDYLYIIVVTVRQSMESLVQAFALGADDYLVKPLDAKLLAARVEAGVRIARLERQPLLFHPSAPEQAHGLIDPQSNLPNRRFGQMRLFQECAGAQRYGKGFGVLLLQVSDKDKSLDLAKSLAQRLRLSDVLVRWDRHRFLILCPDTDDDGLVRLARRLYLDSQKEGIMLHIGIAAWEGQQDSREALLARAEAAVTKTQGHEGAAIAFARGQPPQFLPLPA